MKKKLLLAMVIAGAAGILAGCKTAQLDLSQYLKVEFSGVDGKGRVSSYSVDKDKLEDAIRDANDDLSNKEREKLMDTIELEVKKNEKLSNGDKVKIDIEWNKRKAERYGIEFVSEEAEVKVSGLKEMKSIDAFKELEISYTGTSPYLKMDVDNESDNDFLQECYYEVEYPKKRNYAKIGDKVKVKVNYSEYNSEEYGYVPKADSEEIEVKKGDADAYIDTADQISDEFLKTMSETAQKAIEDDVYGRSYAYRAMMEKLTGQTYNWDFDINTLNKTNPYNVKKIEVYKVKDLDDGYYHYSYVTLIMEHTVFDAVNAGGVTIYYAVKFPNVVLTKEGELDFKEGDAQVAAYAGSIENLDELLVEEDFEEDTYEKSEVSK